MDIPSLTIDGVREGLLARRFSALARHQVRFSPHPDRIEGWPHSGTAHLAQLVLARGLQQLKRFRGIPMQQCDLRADRGKVIELY